jgi:hypothetical protein
MFFDGQHKRNIFYFSAEKNLLLILFRSSLFIENQPMCFCPLLWLIFRLNLNTYNSFAENIFRKCTTVPTVLPMNVAPVPCQLSNHFNYSKPEISASKYLNHSHLLNKCSCGHFLPLFLTCP